MNSIVLYNYDLANDYTDNYGYGYVGSVAFSYSCTDPLPGFGTGNIDADPQFLDWFRIPSTSPCRGAGSPLYSSGTDLDGESWANPPSIGCEEVVLSNRVGPLSVAIVQSPPPALATHS